MFHRTSVFVSIIVHVFFVYFMQLKGMCETCHCILIFKRSFHFNLIVMRSWIVQFKFQKTMLFKSRNYNSYHPTNLQNCNPRFNVHTFFVAQVFKIQLSSSIFFFNNINHAWCIFNQTITWHVCVVLRTDSL